MQPRSIAQLLAIGAALAFLPAAPTLAATRSPAMAACSSQWADMKKTNKVPQGQTWTKFWSQCSKDYAAAHPENAPANTATTPKDAAGGKAGGASTAAPAAAAPAAAAGAATTTGKKPATPGQQAERNRIKACGQEWKAAKAANKIPAGMKWPQYWSDCNKRLKAQGQ